MQMRDGIIASYADGEPVTAPARRVVRSAAATLATAACLFAGACALEPPRPVALREDIAVGPYVFRVLSARNAPNPPPPISTFRDQPGKKGVVVSVYWKTLDDNMDVVRRLAFIENFLTDNLSIADSEGKRTEAFHAMQEKLMYMGDPGPNWRDWVVVFFVPNESRDLTLIVENPEPREGQTRFTSTTLGR
jgi:hypothetical protein